MKTDNGGNIIKRMNRKHFFPVIHMIITSLYMVWGLKYEPLPFGNMTPVCDINWGKGCEKAAHVLMAGVFGFCLICIVWYVLFLLIKKKKILPFVLVGMAFMISLMAFPSSFSYEPDNMVVYSHAIRDMPDYWQSIYLGCLYKACLFVFPHPLMISFLQLSSLFGVLYYISSKAGKMFGKKAAWVPYLLILFPEFLELGFSPYRNCIYTIMCLWFYAFLFFECLEKKERPAKVLILLSLSGGLLTVFRSEGIIVFGILVAAFWYIYRMSVKRICKYLVLCAFICLLLMFPQKLGEKKYYGQDYSMINSMNMLKTILSDENVNLKFKTVEEDLTAIHRIVPLDELPTYGIHAYRANNFAKKGTINQSFASKEESEAFMRSVKNLILSNPGLFLKDRLVMFCEANGINSVRVDPYPTESWNQMFAVLAGEWSYSYGEIVGDSFPQIIFADRQKIGFSDAFTDFQMAYYNLVCKSNLIFSSRILVFLLFPLLVIYDIKLCAKNKLTFFAVSALLLLIQLAAVILFCPEGRNVYYFPSYFVMLTGCFLLSLDIMKKSRQVKVMLPPVTNRL